jgi:hypothetical protein
MYPHLGPPRAGDAPIHSFEEVIAQKKESTTAGAIKQTVAENESDNLGPDLHTTPEIEVREIHKDL